jgi:uncharacterized protein YdeI (YjbR/CyaY-like superfamily)
LPLELKHAFDKDPLIKDAFYNLTPFKQREYAEYVGEAKREETRRKRLEKCLPMIHAGKGLNDRYR